MKHLAKLIWGFAFAVFVMTHFNSVLLTAAAFAGLTLYAFTLGEKTILEYVKAQMDTDSENKNDQEEN